MRRSDWIAIILVGALVGGVGWLILTAPRRAAPVVAVAPDSASARADSTPDSTTDAAGSARISIVRRGEVGVRVVRSGNPPPPHDLEEIRRHLMLGAPGTYIGDVLALQDSQLVRWPDATVLRVWIARSTDARDWSPAYVDTVRAAFRAWDAAGAPIRTEFVDDSASASVHVRWIDRFPGDGTIGQTQQTWDQYRWLVAGDITIATHTVDGDVLDAQWVRATALHEIGHLLGVNHSLSPGDIMAATAHSFDLSRADLATMRLLYVLPPGSVSH